MYSYEVFMVFQDFKRRDFLYGINPVQAAIHSNKRQLDELFIHQGSEDHVMNPRLTNILSHANTINLPIKFVHKKKIESMVGAGQPHQNVILKCEPKKFLRVANVNEIGHDFIIFFDQITDPQNFGSIIRTAFFLGVEGLIVEEKNRCPLTPTISKVSSGAVEMVDIHSTNQALQFIKHAKEQGYQIIGTGLSTNQKTINCELEVLKKVTKKKLILIFGSESQGVSPQLLHQSDFNIIIPQQGGRQFPHTLIDSLNVGVSAGVIINTLKTAQVLGTQE